MMQFGEYLTTCSVTAFMIPKLTLSRSSRLMPGLRGTPEVMTTTSELAVCGVVGAADDAAVRPGDRARLEHVERDARGLLVGDVDDDDVGQLLVGDTAGDGRADVAGSTHHGHFAIHRLNHPCWLTRLATSGSGLQPRCASCEAPKPEAEVPLVPTCVLMIASAELRRLQLGGAGHQAREVVGDALGGDRAVHPLHDQSAASFQPEVPEHHLARQDDRARD